MRPAPVTNLNVTLAEDDARQAVLRWTFSETLEKTLYQYESRITVKSRWGTVVSVRQLALLCNCVLVRNYILTGVAI